MDEIKFELDKDSLEAAVMAAFEKAVDVDGFEYECPGCGTAMTVTSGDNECPRCGFVLTVEKGES